MYTLDNSIPMGIFVRPQALSSRATFHRWNEIFGLPTKPEGEETQSQTPVFASRTCEVL